MTDVCNPIIWKNDHGGPQRPHNAVRGWQVCVQQSNSYVGVKTTKLRRTTIVNKIAPEVQGSLDRVGAKDARPVQTPIGGV